VIGRIAMPQPVTRRLRDATFAVVDVETTGVDPTVDRVVEVACARIRGGREIDAFSSLVHPGRHIPAVASAVHHLTDREVQFAPALEDLRARLSTMCADAIVVAHNARFDLAFLPFLAQRPSLCTMRLAMRVLPDAPNYKNQVLRYHLCVDGGMHGEAIAHRARGDVQVTSRILTICLERYLAAGGSDDVDALVHRIAAPRRLPTLSFGRHRGIAIEDVPADYLRWLQRESLSASVDARYTAGCELRRRAAGV
jgi:DNA polymerase III alpha subunit (gram-positive type)